jgi:hypothetical protein
MKGEQPQRAHTSGHHSHVHAAALLTGLRLVRGLEKAFARGPVVRSRAAQVLEMVMLEHLR